MAPRTRTTANDNETEAVAGPCPILDEMAAAFRHVSIGTAIATSEGCLIDVNPAFCRMLGYTRDELLALGFDGINHPDDRGLDPVRWPSLAAGDRDTYQREKRYLRNDGSLLYVLITISALRDDDGQFVGGLAQIQDITAQKAAEAALRDNETRLASLVGQLPVALYTLDPDEGGAFGFVSPQFAGLTGFRPGSDAGTFAERLALVHPDDREFVRATNERCDRTGEPMEIEYRLRGVDGDWIWVYNQAVLTRDEHGEPLAWHGVVLDISARKRLEASLRESEQRFRRAFADAGTGMSLCTPEWIVLDANDAYCRLVGRPRDGVVGRSIAAFTHPEDLAAGNDEHARLVTGDVDAYQIEKRYVRPDGAVVTGLLTVSAVRDESGAFLYDIGQTQDITAQKAAEAALRENETRLRELVDQLPAALYRQDVPGDGTKTYVSPSLATMLGIDAADLPLGFASFFARMHPDDRAAAEEAAARAERTGEAMDLEYRLRRSDGDWIWVHDRSVLERDGDGQPRAWTGVLLDVSERKRLEAALRESEAHLRTIVEQLPAALYSLEPGENGRYVFASPRFAELTGLAWNGQGGDLEAVFARIHPDDVQAVRDGDAAAARTGEPLDLQYRVLGSDGRWHWVHDRSALARDERGQAKGWHGVLLDISEQKRIEQALQENEAHLQIMVDRLSVAFYSIEPAPGDKYTYLSPQFSALTGLDLEDLSGGIFTFFDRVHPEDIPAIYEADRRADETGEPSELEFRIRNAAGDWIWVFARAVLARDELGRPLAWHGMMVDITEHKRLEAALRDNATRLELVANSLSVGFYSQDPGPGSPFTYVSPQYAALTGLDPTELTGSGLDGFFARIHPDDVAAVREADRHADETGEPFEIEFRIRNAAGDWIWVHNRGLLARDEQGRPLAWHGVLLDVGERKRLEAALREQAAHMELLVEQLPVAVYSLEPRMDGHFTYVSPQFATLTGMTAEDMERGLPAFYDRVHPDDYPAVRAEAERATTTGEPFEIEYRVRHGDDEWLWLLNRANLLRDGQGRPVAWHGVFLDVSERHALEVSLRDSEERFRRAFDGAGIGMALTDPRGPIFDVNRALCDFLGYTRDELRTMTFLDITHPDDVDLSLDWVGGLTRGEFDAYSLEKRYVRKDGQTVWGLLTSSAVRTADGRVLNVIAQIQDITARKQAEEALRHSEERFRRAFEDAGIGMTLADPRGPIFDANPAFCRFIGRSRDELRSMSFFDITHPDDRAVSIPYIERLIAGEIDGYALDKRYIHADGHTVWGHLTTATVRGEDGQPLYSISQIQDITARKDAEAALRDSEARFRSIFEGAGIGMALASPRGTILLANPALERLLGYAAGELVGVSVDAITHQEDLPAQAEQWRRLRSGDTDSYAMEKRYLRRDGGFVWALVDVAAVRADGGALTATVAQVQDVTARKEAQAALASREALFRSIFEEAGIGMSLVSREGIVLLANRALGRILGYEPEELAGMAIDDLSYAVDPVWQKEARQRIRSGEIDSYTIEKHYLRKDGGHIWALVDSTAIRDERGRMTATIGQVQDITARREAEEALRESEARFRSIFAGAGIGMALVDPAGVIMVANPALERLLGYEADALEGVRIDDLTYPEDIPLQVEQRRLMLAGETDAYQFEKRYLRKDGAMVWGLLTGVAVRDDRGDLMAVIGQVQDITARKEAAAALRESEARFRALVDNDPDVIAVIDDAGMLTYVSPSVQAALGVAAEDLLGPVEPLLRYLHPDDLEQVLALYGEVGTRTGAAAAAEVRVKHRTLGWRWFVITMANQIDYPGINGYLFNLRDITERKEAELATAAALRAQQTAIAELERLNRSKSRFLSTISHEFRTPLTAIIGFSELLASDTADTATVAEDAAVIHREASRLNRMVDDVLLVERLDTGHMPLNPRPVNLNTIAADVVETFRPLAGAHRFVLDLARRPRLVDGDPDRLAQALTNLVGNAVKYSPVGGTVTIATRNDGDEVVLSVRDEGIGIAPDDLSRIFDRFERVETGTAGRIPGTGLGLYIVREIVALHNGRLRVESVPNDGTTFSLTLPARKPGARIRKSGAKSQ